MASYDPVLPKKDWTKIGAIAQIVAVLIAIATLFYMWWLDKKATTKAAPGDATVTPLMWWMPVLIAATVICSGVLYYLAARVAKRNQSPLVSDPMVASLQQELNETRGLLAEANSEKRAMVARAEQAEHEKRKQAEMLSRAPTLWVTYKPKTDKETESLIFEKDGSHIKTIEVGPLVWAIRATRPISLFNVIGPLRDKPVECKFTALERVGDGQVVHELPDLLREMMRRFGGESQPSIDVDYEDFDGNRFRRRFTLSIDPYNRIAWDAGRVELRP